MGRRTAQKDVARNGMEAGQPVSILRLPRDGPPYIEGRATLGGYQGGCRYWVRFDGEPGWRLRAVHLQLQHDPAALIAALIDLWRAEQGLNASFSDFFPTDQP